MHGPDPALARGRQRFPLARTCATLLLALTLVGCASRNRVILLPDTAGHVGRIAVLQQQGSIVLDRAYESAVTDARGGVDVSRLDAGTVSRQYGAELTALPSKPETFQLHFMIDSIQLTPASEAEAPVLVQQIVGRPDAEVILVGHSQSEAPVFENDQLSLMRAMLIRSRLLAAGLGSQRIRIAAADSTRPDPPSDDAINRPPQRRVEIRVR